MKVEQRDIKFTYHFSRGNETMKSLLENSGCRERTPSCQGQRVPEDLQPDVSDHRGRSPTRTPSQQFPRAFVSNGFDIFIPKWLLPARNSFILEALESSEPDLQHVPLPSHSPAPWKPGRASAAEATRPPGPVQVPSLKGDGVTISGPPQGAQNPHRQCLLGGSLQEVLQQSHFLDLRGLRRILCWDLGQGQANSWWVRQI